MKKSPSARKLKPWHLWSFVFGLWAIFLTGALSGLVGSPGVIQAVSLTRLYEARQKQANDLQEELKRLQDEAVQLEKNKLVQQREIRRILGYAAPDELIFDFSPGGEL